ncbi:MAG: EcsC family protein [Deltaproteobacteria bacterium]|nr:EcsC family protein [Deltaproteobacteria bacterium]
MADFPPISEIARTRLDRLIIQEIEIARPKTKRLKKRYPLLPEADLAQQLIDEKKAYAGTGGMVSGFFGLLALPADLLLVTFLQLRLIVELGQLFRVNLKSERGQSELLEILGRGNGVGPLYRTGPTVFARLALRILQKKGLSSVGRAVPLVAAPVSAWLNNRDIQRVGDEALRQWGRRRQLAEKRWASEE